MALNLTRSLARTFLARFCKGKTLVKYSSRAERLTGFCGLGREYQLDSMKEVVNTSNFDARERTMVKQGDMFLNSQLMDADNSQ